MTEKQPLLQRLAANPRPVILDVWAPWCPPCRAIRPSLTRLAEEFRGRVDLWELNADQAPELVRGFGISGIPTLLVFHQGQETGRRTGAQPETALRELFVAAEQGTPPPARHLTMPERWWRGATSVALAVLALATGPTWWLLVAAAIIGFSAVHDRCPIWQALAPRMQRAWRRAFVHGGNTNGGVA
jgi:thioredoxin 1